MYIQYIFFELFLQEKNSWIYSNSETNRSSGGAGSLQPEAEGSAEPEAESSATFEQTVTSHPTSSYP